jgi:DNA-binding GntR family transcriptional regulator
MLEIVPATKRALPDEATDRLSHAIITGRLKPGERINEGEIANLLQISRGPVREALATLVSRGLVVKIVNRGAFVVSFSLEDVKEVCSLRATLEQFAVKLLLERPQPIDLEEMACVVSDMGAAANSQEAELILSELDLRFHAALVAAANHKRLFDAWNNLRPQIQMLLYTRNVLNEDFRELAVKGHRDILDALNACNGELARKVLQAHLNLSYERIYAAYLANLPPRAG